MKKLLLLLLCSPLFGDQVAVSKFGLLNDNSPATAIANEQAQDLLNVDVTPGGLSVKKRAGYGVYKALATGQAVHGGFHAFDSSGNDYQLWGSSTSLYSIVQDATPTQIISSATLNSTWDCADTQGNSYCVTSNRDLFLKTNGTTKIWYTAPLGTMVESTPDRVIVAGVLGSPNTLFVSQSNTFTNFTTGVAATDAFNEVIASPGSHITHIRWGCAKLLWWKDTSFGYFDFDDQFTAQVKTVSDTIGTLDNTSAIDPAGRVWFRGQDGHTWMYDCSALTKQSIDITPDVQASGKRIANSWVQSSQSDFQAGVSTPTLSLSFTYSPGDVVISSYSVSDYSSAQWSAGSKVGMAVYASSVAMTPSTNNTLTVVDPSFENSSAPNFSSSWVLSSGGNSSAVASQTMNFCTMTPQQGSVFFRTAGMASSNGSVQIIDANTSILLAQTTIGSGLCQTASCAWTASSVSSSGLLGRRIKLRIYDPKSNVTTTSSAAFTLGGDINFFYACIGDSGSNQLFIDNISGGISSVSTGTFTSQAYSTTAASATYYGAGITSIGAITPSFAIQTSTSSNGPWTSIMTNMGTTALSNGYVRYTTTFTATGTDSVFPALTSFNIVAVSSASFYSAVHNAPNLTTWSSLQGSQQLNGGTENFFIRASTVQFSLLSTTPTWVAQTIGNQITASTGTYFQLRDDFNVTYTTQTPTLNDFTMNWFEGAAADQAYMLYFDNAIWQSVAFGAGQSVNNYIFKYDLINDGWTRYNLGAGGLLSTAQTLYFGDTAAGNVYNFGTATSDNGASINAYWRSKAFTGADPFLQNQLTNIDTFAKKNQGTTLTATYTVENSTATAYSISLSTGNAAFIQSRKILPSGKLGYTFDMKYGDTSASSAWELLGFRIGFAQQPYRPAN